MHDTANFTATTMCCECGGGHMPRECKDTAAYKNGGTKGQGCQPFYKSPAHASAHCSETDNAHFTASEACCACGGGDRAELSTPARPGLDAEAVKDMKSMTVPGLASDAHEAATPESADEVAKPHVKLDVEQVPEELPVKPIPSTPYEKMMDSATHSLSDGTNYTLDYTCDAPLCIHPGSYGTGLTFTGMPATSEALCDQYVDMGHACTWLPHAGVAGECHADSCASDLAKGCAPPDWTAACGNCWDAEHVPQGCDASCCYKLGEFHHCLSPSTADEKCIQAQATVEACEPCAGWMDCCETMFCASVDCKCLPKSFFYGNGHSQADVKEAEDTCAKGQWDNAEDCLNHGKCQWGPSDCVKCQADELRARARMARSKLVQKTADAPSAGANTTAQAKDEHTQKNESKVEQKEPEHAGAVNGGWDKHEHSHLPPSMEWSPQNDGYLHVMEHRGRDLGTSASLHKLWLAPETYHPLLQWSSTTGERMVLSGQVIAQPDGDEWFKTFAIAAGRRPVFNVSAKASLHGEMKLSVDGKRLQTFDVDSSLSSAHKAVTVESKTNANGTISLHVRADPVEFSISGRTASTKFSDPVQIAEHAHLAIGFGHGIPKQATGLLAELAGVHPMSEHSMSLTLRARFREVQHKVEARPHEGAAKEQKHVEKAAPHVGGLHGQKQVEKVPSRPQHTTAHREAATHLVNHLRKGGTAHELTEARASAASSA